MSINNKAIRMDKDKEDIIKVLTTAGMIAILTGLSRALFVKTEAVWVRVRVFFASVIFGILVGVILRNTDLSEFKKEMLISISTAFGYTVWPLLEQIVYKWVAKKGGKINDVLCDNDN